MKTTRIAALTAVALFGAPQYALAATVDVPRWLPITSGAVGLVVAAVLMIDAIRLRNVAEGSMIAENIVYMLLAVVCFAASMLARWAYIFTPDRDLAAFITLAGDLLMTVGMALLLAYFVRVRTSMVRYLRSVQAYQASAADEGEAGG